MSDSHHSSKAIHSWREALQIYFKPRVLTMLFLGFSAGLPFLLVFSTLTAWLTQAGVTRSVIGFFSWVGITYSIKILWAPIIDRVPLPFLNRILGKRRSWMFFGQCGIMLGLYLMAGIQPENNLTFFALAALLVAFSSATQDVALDAYRIEAMQAEYQGAMAAMYIGGYRLGILVAGAGALYLSKYAGWTSTYLFMAMLVSIGMITVVIIREPDRDVNAATWEREQRVVDFLENSAHLPDGLRKPMAWFIGAVVCPLTDFFQREGSLAIVILLLISVFRMSDIVMGGMANPFYLDLGFSVIEIANITKFFGFFVTLFGAALGGILVVRYGIMRPMLLGAVMVAVTNLLFAMMATMEPNLVFLAIVISADNLSGGLAISAFIAYLSSLTNKAYTATQYALFSSIMTLFPKIVSGFSGVVVDAQGYFFFFVYAAVTGVPAILLVLYIMRKQKDATQQV